MPKKKILLIAIAYGYQKLKRYEQIDDEHYRAESIDCGTKIVINIRTKECFKWNPYAQRLVRLAWRTN